MKHWYSPTAFKNEEDQQAARILLVLILALWAINLIAGLTGLYWSDWKLITATLAGSVLQAVPLWLLRRGHLRASSLIFVMSVIGTVTIVAMVGQGIRDLAIVAFPIVFIFASMALSRAYFRLCVGLTFAATSWLAIGEANGWFVPRPFPEDPSNWFYLISVTVLLLVAAVTVDLLATNMRKSLELARHEIAQRKRAEDDLRELNATLEQRVADRTAELQAANAQLTELDRLKDEFISRISHELRTPLANIKLYLGLLDHGKPEKHEQYMATLLRETARLQQLIEDLLRISQLDLDAVHLPLTPIDVNQLLAQLVIDRASLVRDQGLRIESQLALDLPLAAANSTLLMQALSNLMTNATNYTPAGGTITLSTALQSSDDRAWVTCTLRDTGLGISAKDQQHIFERFYRGAAASDYTIPGTGLGLSICHEIVNKLGGRITVESEPGHGAAFTVWLKPVD